VVPHSERGRGRGRASKNAVQVKVGFWGGKLRREGGLHRTATLGESPGTVPTGAQELTRRGKEQSPQRKRIRLKRKKEKKKRATRGSQKSEPTRGTAESGLGASRSDGTTSRKVTTVPRAY